MLIIVEGLFSPVNEYREKTTESGVLRLVTKIVCAIEHDTSSASK
jgi:hypothetical protein